jgi:putative SOS response-associated peptidase YedK
MKTAGGKQPYWLGLSDQSLFAFAGLWEPFRSSDREFESFTIITCGANELVAGIHDRMPVILPEETYSSWLDPKTGSSDLLSLLTPFPSQLMKTFRVSRLVNSPGNDDSRCIEPSEEQPPPLFR